MVNQLLSKIDGVDQLNNILVIGMTNRKDMIDDALLRPGRLEVQMEIGTRRLVQFSVSNQGMDSVPCSPISFAHLFVRKLDIQRGA